MVTLGGGLALISVGQWDEESATTIEMPAVPAADSPAEPDHPTEPGPAAEPRSVPTPPRRAFTHTIDEPSPQDVVRQCRAGTNR